jgi:hypothetical protein
LNAINTNISIVKEYFNSGKTYEYLLDNFSNIVINMFEEFIIKNDDALKKEYPRIGEMIYNRRERLNEMYIDFFRKGKEKDYYVHLFDPELTYDFLNGIIEYNIKRSKSQEEFKEKMYLALKILIRGIKK